MGAVIATPSIMGMLEATMAASRSQNMTKTPQGVMG